MIPARLRVGPPRPRAISSLARVRPAAVDHHSPTAARRLRPRLGQHAPRGRPLGERRLRRPGPASFCGASRRWCDFKSRRLRLGRACGTRQISARSRRDLGGAPSRATLARRGSPPPASPRPCPRGRRASAARPPARARRHVGRDPCGDLDGGTAMALSMAVSRGTSTLYEVDDIGSRASAERATPSASSYLRRRRDAPGMAPRPRGRTMRRLGGAWKTRTRAILALIRHRSASRRAVARSRSSPTERVSAVATARMYCSTASAARPLS